MAVAAGPRGPSPPVAQGAGCPRPIPVEVDGPGGGYAWRAEPRLASVARVLGRHEPAYAEMPGIGPPPVAAGDEPVRIYLLSDLACLRALELPDPGADWVAGVASRDAGFVALRVDGPQDPISSLRVVLRHELAHLALDRATDGRAPRWLHEGYAQLASGAWDWQQAWRLRWVFLRGGGERLRRLSLRFPSDPQGARLAYQLSYTAVQELYSLAGVRGLRAYFAALRDGATPDGAFRRVFGITQAQFEDRWRRTVQGRYGLLYTLTRAGLFWAAVSILVIWVAWRRRRRDREKLEALREEDRREEEARRRVTLVVSHGPDPSDRSGGGSGAGGDPR